MIHDATVIDTPRFTLRGACIKLTKRLGNILEGG
jgi:hypothetical protein